nr:helix-turn-helix domain-containing protein [Burkholderia sp. Ac-20345]
MHPEDIKASIRKANSSPARIARELDISRNAVSLTIHGRSKSIRVARRICEVAGLDPEAAWPGCYPEFRVNPIACPVTPENRS